LVDLFVAVNQPPPSTTGSDCVFTAILLSTLPFARVPGAIGDLTPLPRNPCIPFAGRRWPFRW